MSNNLYLIFSILGIIVFALAIYLGILINKIKLQKQYIKDKEEEFKLEMKKREEFIVESLYILARAVINEQCDISEGTIRIKNLKDKIEYLKDNNDLNMIDEYFKEIDKFAILEDRNALSKQARFKEDNERYKLEAIYMNKVKEGCENLLKLLDNHKNQAH